MHRQLNHPGQIQSKLASLLIEEQAMFVFPKCLLPQ